MPDRPYATIVPSALTHTTISGFSFYEKRFLGVNNQVILARNF